MNVAIFSHSSSLEDSKHDLKNIISVTERKDNTVHIIQTVAPSSGSTHQDYSTSISNKVKTADAVIIPHTIRGIELGGCISIALQHRKPMFIFYEKQKPDSILFQASNLIMMEEYTKNSIQELDTILKPFFETIKKKRLLYRFNLMLSKEMNLFLESMSKRHGISKADYLRQLIQKEIIAV